LRIPRQFISVAVKKVSAIALKNARWDGSGELGFSSGQKFVRNCAQKWQMGRFRANEFQQPSQICAQLRSKIAGGTVPGHWVSRKTKPFRI